jgi:hypothetical protein
MKALGKYHQFCIYTYFLFQNVFTSLLRSAQVSYYLLFPSKYESGFELRNLHSLLQLPAWRMNYELCQYAIVLLLLIIPLITFKWIHICMQNWWYLPKAFIIFQLYRGGQFYWWRKPEYPEKSDLWQTLNREPKPYELKYILSHRLYFAENTRLTFLCDPALGPHRHIRKFF